MNTISVLIVIDTEGALASGMLINNTYLVDTNHYLGSWQEGTDDLHTLCQDGQLINWSITAVSPSSDVAIIGFTGPMVAKKICTPAVQGLAGDTFWSGQVETHGSFATYPYSVNVSLGGRLMSFSPYIKVA